MGAPRSGERAALDLHLSDRIGPPRRIVYGRRKGRRLRPGQRDLLREVLARVGIALPESGSIEPAGLFSTAPRELWLEIGFGAGEHLAEQAALHPEVGFLGAEVFENGVVRLLAEIEKRRLQNVRVLMDDARMLLRGLPDRSLGRVFILFPDPWPKLRHHKRRMVSPATLGELARAMREGAELRLATDDPGYLQWMLELVPMHWAFEWLVQGPSDWRERPPDWPQTRYERKALDAGRRPYFVRFRRRPSGPECRG